MKKKLALIIKNTETVDYKEATTIRKDDGEKEKSKKSRSEIRTKAFKETKLLNFYNVAGIRFNNIATNDAMIRSKLNEMSSVLAFGQLSTTSPLPISWILINPYCCMVNNGRTISSRISMDFLPAF